MKQIIQTALVFSGLLLGSCSAFKAVSVPPVTDLVCGMKVNPSEAYTWKYKNEKYYFCSYTCKETFKMNPEKILEKCATNK